MKFVRYKTDKAEYRGILDGDRITMISGSIFHEYSLSNEKIPLKGVTLLPPILPGKIIGLRKNYEPNDAAPLLFIKPASSVIGPKENIILSKNLDRVMAEGELAAVIGKKCKNVKEEHALSYVFGYTIANDVTGISCNYKDTVTASKAFDTFSPIGPLIDTSTGWENLEIKTHINGELKQSGNTSSMFFKVPYMISYISSIMTLDAGDVILTGTPSPAVEIKDGDEIEISIENIGTLKSGAVNG